MTCISCGKEHEEAYCPYCGEKGEVKKITFASMVQHTISLFIDMDRGFLYNFKSLFIAPKLLAEDYIKGRRKDILNPVSFLVFSVGLYLLIEEFLRVPLSPDEIIKRPQEGIYRISYELGIFIRIHLKYFWILSILPLGLSLRMIYKRYNFAEHVTISSLIIGQATLISIISHLIFRNILIFDPILYFFIVWMIYNIYKDDGPKTESMVLSFLSFCIFIFLMVFIIIAMGVVRYLFTSS